MPVLARDFHILQGEPKPWRHLSPTGVPVISWFCGSCGGRLYGDRKGREDIVNVRAGTLDDTTWLVPVAHMYLRSAQSWVLPATHAACHEIDAGDFKPLIAAWHAMWPDCFPQK
jgi:hypothetical protein